MFWLIIICRYSDKKYLYKYVFFIDLSSLKINHLKILKVSGIKSTSYLFSMITYKTNNAE